MSDREALRTRAVEKPGFYSPWLHLFTPSVIGAVVVVACARVLRDVRPWQLAFAAFVFVLSNAVEWRVHRDALHKRFPFMEILYERHTPLHHCIFIKGEMSLRDPREFRLILLPAFGILAILSITAPPAALLYWLGQRNLAALYLLITTAYVVLYEWLHLSYHLPEAWLLGPLRAIRVLRQHHETHHDPALMQRWNFNVTVPLWDYVRGTIHR